mgnify:CR=1 FL=1
MAKIVQILTRPSREYRQDVADAQVRDLDSVIQKLNTTYQQELASDANELHVIASILQIQPREVVT